MEGPKSCTVSEKSNRQKNMFVKNLLFTSIYRKLTKSYTQNCKFGYLWGEKWEWVRGKKMDLYILPCILIYWLFFAEIHYLIIYVI